MKNKWVKRLVIAGLSLVVCVVGLHIGLHILSSRAWVHQKISEKLAQATGREVRLGHALLNLRGVSVQDFALSKLGGFEVGEMFHVQQAQVRVSLWHLLYGHLKIKAIEVNGLSLRVVRDENGKLNVDFSDGTSSDPSAEKDSSGKPFSISIDVLSARNLYISYEDKQTQLQTELQQTDISVRRFAWDEPFEVRFNTSVIYQQNEQKLQVPVGLVAKVNLAELDLANASVEISSLSLRCKEARLRGEGSVRNFINPQFNFALHGENFSTENFEGFVPAEYPFALKRVSARAQGAFSSEQAQLRLEDSALLLPGAELTSGGLMRFAGGEYDMVANLKVQLAELAEGLLFLSSYKLAGNLTMASRVTHKQLSVQGELSDGNAVVPQVGKLAAVRATLDANGQMDGKKGQGVLGITGELNGEKIQADFSFTQTPQELVANLKAAADRLILPSAPPEENAQAGDAAQEIVAEKAAPVSEEKSTWPFPPLTAKADVKFGSLDAPYLNGKDFNFQLDMKGITPKMDNAHGSLVLSVSDGEITDLYKLTDSNALMKVLFMSLNVVGKVFNSLDVLSVLGGLAGSFDKSDGEEVIKMVPDENGELVPVKVPAHARKMDGALVYDKFVTDVQFDNGLATVKAGHFVSNMMSFNLSGTTDFNTEKIDMTVHAAPGKHETDGVMPLTLKIGGTVSEPTGNMSVMGSVTSLVAQGVTNNFASRAVKKTVGGVFGLFKKKTKEEPTAENTTSQETAPETMEEQPAGENSTDSLS